MSSYLVVAGWYGGMWLADEFGGDLLRKVPSTIVYYGFGGHPACALAMLCVPLLLLMPLGMTIASRIGFAIFVGVVGLFAAMLILSASLTVLRSRGDTEYMIAGWAIGTACLAVSVYRAVSHEARRNAP